MGNGDNTPQHLLAPDNTKVYTDTEKELIHREHMTNIFTDDYDPDEDNETNTVRQFLNDNLRRQSPYHYANLSRLDATSAPFHHLLRTRTL